MVIIVYLALAFAQYKGDHVIVEIASSGLSETWRRRLDLLAALICLSLVLFFLYISVDRALAATHAGEYRVASIRVPIWPFRWAIPCGLALLALQLLGSAVRLGTRRSGE